MRKVTLRYLLNVVVSRAHSVLVFLRYYWWKLLFKRLGKNVRIFGGITVQGAQYIAIGANCTINKYTIMEATEDAPITIGSNVRISSNVTLLTESLQYEEKAPRPHFAKEIVIEDNVWLGSRSIILPGIKVGKNSVIGAGSVVTKDIPPDSVAVGVPAKVIKKVGPPR